MEFEECAKMTGFCSAGYKYHTNAREQLFSTNKSCPLLDMHHNDWLLLLLSIAYLYVGTTRVQE